MNYVFDYDLEQAIADGGMTQERILAVCRSLNTYIEVKHPSKLSDLPALPFIIYPLTFNLMPREVKKYYRPVELPIGKRSLNLYMLNPLEGAVEGILVEAKVVW